MMGWVEMWFQNEPATSTLVGLAGGSLSRLSDGGTEEYGLVDRG